MWEEIPLNGLAQRLKFSRHLQLSISCRIAQKGLFYKSLSESSSRIFDIFIICICTRPSKRYLKENFLCKSNSYASFMWNLFFPGIMLCIFIFQVSENIDGASTQQRRNGVFFFDRYAILPAASFTGILSCRNIPAKSLNNFSRKYQNSSCPPLKLLPKMGLFCIALLWDALAAIY